MQALGSLTCLTALRSLALTAGLAGGSPTAMLAAALVGLTSLELQHSGDRLVGTQAAPLAGLPLQALKLR